ncbi:MAG: FAD-dependent oxidoreductase, partial [Acholeplasmatales bacterium]|nr:FAD-dependent oxidoreductase [Acholeplasmatales bacterium]
GNMNDTIPAMGTRDYAFMKEECIAIKNVVSIPVSIVGRVINVDMAEELLEEGVCDYIGFGRPLLADPDIVNKTEAGLKHLIRKCICCNKGCTDNIQNRKGLECVLNPENGSEYKRVITPAEVSKKVAIVGGGVAGLEAARVCAIKGHIPTVYEKTDKLYGQINIASVPPRKSEMLRIANYYDEVIKHYNIDIKLNTEFTKADAEGYDEIIVATGAVNAHPSIKGIETTVDSWDVLAGLELPKGHVLVAGGGLVGVETAEYLLERGYTVSIIEMQDKIAKEESSTILPTIMASFKAHNVNVHTFHKISEFNKTEVICDVIDKYNNLLETVTIKGDVIVNALASKKIKIDLEGVANVHYVGDCKDGAPCNIDNATKSAYDIANSL